MAETVTFDVVVPKEHAAQAKRLLDDLCAGLPLAHVTLRSEAAVDLANLGHRGCNERVERMLGQGLLENAARAVAYKLPEVTREAGEYTTQSMSSVRTVDTLLNRPLPNTTHGNLGADIVVLVRDPAQQTAYTLHLIQLKRGTTPIGYPKKNCGPSNEGRSSYHIHAKLAKIGKELTATLLRAFPEEVARVTPAYHLITTAPVRESARVLLAKHNVNLVQGDTAFTELMPKDE